MAVASNVAKSMTDGPEAASPAAMPNEPIIIDLGRKRRRLVKQLREGRGKLMTEISTCIQELKDGGTISSNVQPVIVIVRQKPKALSPLLPLLR